MTKIIVSLLSLFLIWFNLPGCAARYGTYDPESKQALRTLAGGAVGALLAGNTGGAIVGAFVSDIYNISTVKYVDKQIENEEEAAKRYKDQYEKAEEKKEEKKAEEPKEEQKKVGEIEEEEKKTEKLKEEKQKVEKKKEEKKAEEPREEQKKVGEIEEEEKKAEKKRAKLFVEKSFVATQTVKPGAMVEANVQYTLLAPEDSQEVRITETRVLSTINKVVEVDKREVVRTQGTYVSTIKFKIPEDMPRGYCILLTTISIERNARSAKSVINII